MNGSDLESQFQLLRQLRFQEPARQGGTGLEHQRGFRCGEVPGGHCARTGSYLVRITFLGAENVNYGHTVQAVCVPGECQFQACVREPGTNHEGSVSTTSTRSPAPGWTPGTAGEEAQSPASARQLRHIRRRDCVAPLRHVLVPGDADLPDPGSRGLDARRVVLPVQEGPHF